MRSSTRAITIARRVYSTLRVSSLPTVQSCPAATCTCREMPPGLDIEKTQSLKGTMPAYAEQLLISTGKNDWSSRIEDDADGELVRLLKNYIGPKGKYSNPFHNVMLTHSSFPTSKSSAAAAAASAYILPSFRYIPSISLEPDTVDKFVKAFLLPTDPPLHTSLSPGHTIALRQPNLQQAFPEVRDVNEILVLICGHGNRDSRCGILGPVLQDEFKNQLARVGIQTDTKFAVGKPNARVGLISHIGGHKFAGNIILYLPPTLQGNELAGTGIWYGRVAPEHVEGIVQQTIMKGKIIEDMFRGGIDQDRNILRL